MRNPFKRANQKKPTPPAASISPSAEIKHFDIEAPEAIICCFSCREPLWTMLVRHHQKVVVSTRTLPTGKNSTGFDNDSYDCPLCSRPYVKLVGKDRKLLFRSPKTGKDFVS